MTATVRWHIALALTLLLLALVLGVLAAIAFLFEPAGRFLPFVQLRPSHVTAALFWILTGATAGVLHYKNAVLGNHGSNRYHTLYLALWTGSLLAMFVAYALRKFGGREYWEFPPWIGLPLLLAWLMLMIDYFRAWWRRRPDPPLHVWMWTTGIVFFLVTFIEQNLWLLPWFRENYLREITVQWKSNGAMVGAWNQMIYGTALYLMTRISGDEGIARGPKVFAFWFLGLSNLMFNWGHHIYSVPTASWIRHVAYGISMAEWILLINIIRGFKAKLSEHRMHRHLLTYRFLITSELWVFLNLFLALLMSIPAINRYTHGTHITVAHAMGTTIGINTMILLGSITYMLRIDERTEVLPRLERARLIAVYALLVFWLALIIAGLMKSYRTIGLGMTDHRTIMQPIQPVLVVFGAAGLVLMYALGTIAARMLRICSGATVQAATMPGTAENDRIP